MSEESPEKVPSVDSPAITSPDGADTRETPSDLVTDEIATFSAEYVSELRDEAAKARVKAKRSDALAALAVSAIVEGTGKLIDADDLPYSDDLLDDETGLPSREKIVNAVDELLTKKPHLAKVRVSGDVGQGSRGEVASPISLAAMLRAGAG